MPGFLSFAYWFSLYPPVLQFNMQVVFGALFFICIAAGLLTLLVWRPKLSSKPRKHAVGTIGHTLIWAGICGLVWLLMTVMGVPVLGMRLWVPVGILFFGWLLSGPIRALRSSIPLLEGKASERASYEKWLPKPKK